MRLTGKKIIALVDEEFEDLELWYPVYRVREEGAEVHLAGAEKGKKYIGKYGVPAEAELSYEEIDSSRYDGILVPGGWAPDKLRRYGKVLQIVREMNDAKSDRPDLPRRLGACLRRNFKGRDRDLHPGDPRRYGERRSRLER
ncbi:hypothetical protein HMSSN036_21780 [Paenibacillus macerans]|nr:hypothetical protein HMSSN036_21780 [Paenibacillus macerans]